MKLAKPIHRIAAYILDFLITGLITILVCLACSFDIFKVFINSYFNNKDTLLSFNDMLKCASSSDVVLFCYEGDGTLPMARALQKLRTEKTIKDISIIIGSEGGFSSAEVSYAEKYGFVKIGLGKRILRAETAAIMSLACIVYEFELD